jgi:hypothetical protein
MLDELYPLEVWKPAVREQGTTLATGTGVSLAGEVRTGLSVLVRMASVRPAKTPAF